MEAKSLSFDRGPVLALNVPRPFAIREIIKTKTEFIVILIVRRTVIENNETSTKRS